jgi:DNA replication protein DnaC
MLYPEQEQNRSEDIRRMEEDRRKEANTIEVWQRPVTLAVSTKPNSIRDNQLREIIHGLNEKQRQVFTDIINRGKDTVAAKSPEEKPAPFYLFVTGGAGTGKSQLIKAVFHPVTSNVDYPVILLKSPTGTASYNIGRTTLHAALHLPRGRYYFLRSNPSLLATFRFSMSQLKILVIDDVSMMGKTVFTHSKETTGS